MPPVVFSAPSGGAVVAAEPAVVPRPGAAPPDQGTLAPEAEVGGLEGQVADERLGTTPMAVPPDGDGAGDGAAAGSGGAVAAPEGAGARGRPINIGCLTLAALAAGVLAQRGPCGS